MCHSRRAPEKCRGDHASVAGERQPRDLAAARSGYQDFLALCEHADPDAPLLAEAQAEFATLQ